MFSLIPVFILSYSKPHQALSASPTDNRRTNSVSTKIVHKNVEVFVPIAKLHLNPALDKDVESRWTAGGGGVLKLAGAKHKEQ